MNKNKMNLFFLLLFIPFISATTTIVGPTLDKNMISVDYIGDSEEIRATIQNNNAACDISCDWWIESSRQTTSKTRIANIENGEIRNIPFSITAYGNSPNIFTLSIDCWDNLGSWPCDERLTSAKRVGVKMEFGFCGDGKVEIGEEECDGTNLNGQNCNTQGYEEGDLFCSNCKYDNSNCYKCGDNEINIGEECDLTNLGGNTCQSLGYSTGILFCNRCQFDTSSCTKCGDNICNQDETCSGCSDCACQEGESCIKGICKLDIVELKASITGSVSKEVDKSNGGMLKKISLMVSLIVGLITLYSKGMPYAKKKGWIKEKKDGRNEE